MPKMKHITWKLTVLGYPLLFLWLCVFMIACRGAPQPDASNSSETGTPQSNATPGAVQTEMTKMPRRRDGGNSLTQVLDLDMIRKTDESTSLQMPAVIEAIVAGRNINSVAVIAGRHEADGGRRLVTYELVEPDSAEQLLPIQWPDGIHDLSFIWYTEGDYLSDGTTGDYVLPWQIEPGSNLKTINGRFRRSEDSVFKDSVLMVDTSTGLASELLDTKTGEVIVPEPGAQFQIIDLFLDDSGATITAPGAILTFGEMAQLAYERRTLPQGDYFLGFTTEGGAGIGDSVFANFTVSNEYLLPDLRAYLQPEFGYQFLYPLDWREIIVSGQGVLIGGNSETIKLQIVNDSNLDQVSTSMIKEEVLSSFGEIQVLYEDQVQIGSSGGLRTAYGYESPAGPHTGIFLSFGHDGREYMVDVDGPSAEEATVLEVMGTLIDSWIWRPILDNIQVTEWKSFDIDGYKVNIPTDLRHNLLRNGWHRFSDGSEDSFFAIRIEAQKSGDIDSQTAHWLEVAGRDLGSFISSDIYEHQFSGKGWQRVDFQYNDDELGEIWGAILATESGGDHLIAWFEAPEADYIQMEEKFVMLSLADLLIE
jgi:hypothetical protein